jgi:hypothetical protein
MLEEQIRTWKYIFLALVKGAVPQTTEVDRPLKLTDL